MSPRPSGNASFLETAAEIVLKHIENEQFGVSELARELGMSRSNLHRKIKSINGKSASRFIREVRLNKALELLNDSDLTVSEVAYRVGFASATYFTKCFHDHFGYPPGDSGKYDLTEIESKDHQPDSSRERKIHVRRMLPWMLAGLGLVAALTIFLYFKIVPGSSSDSTNRRTIMVLPFLNDTPGESEDYIINGLMEELLNKLAVINELDVVSRTTSEKYRNTDLSIPQIGKETGATYVLEGSAQSVHNKTRLRLQLIEAESDRHLWSMPYEREISLENLFEIQEEVAILVADELEIVLGFQEVQQIGEITTDNLEAYSAFLKAMDIVNTSKFNDLENLRMAKGLLEEAISLDPAFSEAYTWLGHIYISKLYYTENSRDPEKANAYNDSGHFYLEQALEYNSENWFAMNLNADYYQRTGNYRKSRRIVETVLRKSGANPWSYQGAAGFYLDQDMYAEGIRCYLKYLELKPVEIPVPEYLLNRVLEVFIRTGTTEMVHQVVEQLLHQTQDSVSYYLALSRYEDYMAKYDESIKLAFEAFKLDSSNVQVNNWLRLVYCIKGDLDSMYRYQQRSEALERAMGNSYIPRIFDGYLFLQLGDSSRAHFHLDGNLETSMRQLQLNTPEAQKYKSHRDLTLIYSIRGNRDSTLKYIKCLGEIPRGNIGLISTLKHFPSLEFVRDTPEYKQVLKRCERLYRKEHRRISRLLRKYDLTGV